MTENIATTIRNGWRPPEGAAEAKELRGAAQRLGSALEIAQRWMEASRDGEPEMWSRAQLMHDQIEEERDDGRAHGLTGRLMRDGGASGGHDLANKSGRG